VIEGDADIGRGDGVIREGTQRPEEPGHDISACE
jgi:hypothetical protein